MKRRKMSGENLNVGGLEKIQMRSMDRSFCCRLTENSPAVSKERECARGARKEKSRDCKIWGERENSGIRSSLFLLLLICTVWVVCSTVRGSFLVSRIPRAHDRRRSRDEQRKRERFKNNQSGGIFGNKARDTTETEASQKDKKGHSPKAHSTQQLGSRRP